MTEHDIELPAEFHSGNSIPVERATITRERMTEILKDAIEADRQRWGEPVVLATYHAIIDESEKHIMHDTRTKQLEIYDEREDAVKAAPDHLSVVPVYVTATEGPLYTAPQPALDTADLAFIADELRLAGKNRAADLVLTAMAYPTQPAEPTSKDSDDFFTNDNPKLRGLNELVDEILICTLDGYQYFLGPEYDDELGWDDAKKWCESLGEDYELPNRLVMLAICMNEDTAALLTEDSYWTSSEVEDDASQAWLQQWLSGSPGLQGYASKSHLYRVRAVRRCRIEGDK